MGQNNRFLNFLGLGARSGKLSYGSETCLTGIRDGRIKLLMLDHSASYNTKKQFDRSCRFHKVPLVILDEEDRLGERLGRPASKVIGVVCADFAASALKKYDAASGGENFE
jgi:ribosomal protein L7Ae-like RNA K-turn-binding protein